MKRIVAVFLTLIMIMSFSACGSNNPENITEGFLSAVKDQNKQELLVYAENPYINVLVNNSGNEEEIGTIFSSITKNLSWEIISVEENEDGNAATVKVKISNSDFSGVLGTYQTEAVKYTTDNLESEEFTKEAMAEKCMQIFTQHTKAAAVSDTVTDKEITINLTKDDEGKWNMEVTDELVNAVLGGLQFPL